jgi:hypothetical protein
MNRNWKLLSCLLALGIIGCATLKQPDESTDFGVYPSNYKELIQTYMETRLIDPESARYRFEEEPQKVWGNNPWNGKISWAHYRVRFFCNSKNRLGGYTGGKDYVAAIKDGTILSVCSTYTDSMGFTHNTPLGME